MAALTKVFLIASLALSASALMTPHASRGHNHHDIAARVVSPIPEANVEAVPASRKRANKRCAVRTPSAISSAASSTPINVASSPVLSSSSAEATTTHHESSSVKVTTSIKETTTSAPKTSTKTSSASAPTSSSSGSGDCSEPYLCGTQTGQGTYYATGLGACGITNTDTDFICAVSELLFDTYPGYTGGNPNNNPVCGKKITATYEGKSVTVTVTDRCTGCAQTSLDFSPSAFQQLSDLSVGRLFGMTWTWD